MGQIEPHKGVHLIIEAMAKLKVNVPVELCIYGNELAAPRYTAQIGQLAKGNSRIKILGKYPYEHVAQILSQLDVLIIPSLWNEIGPWVMYEAFSLKTPVIATNIPNMSYVVQNEENGLLFERGNSADLARQINRLANEKDLYAQLVAGIPTVKTITEEMEDLQNAYFSAMQSQAS